ncbi:MAG: hypothetical protein ACI9LN_004490, partial [Saprospiraceae bacterium]
WKLDNLTIFSLLKLKRTFVYTVINHFFNKWWCTFVALPNFFSAAVLGFIWHRGV